MTTAVRAGFGLAVVAILVATPWPLGSRLPWAALGAAALAILIGGTGHGLLLGWGKRPVWTPLDAPALAFLGWTGLQWIAGASVYPFATASEWLKLLGFYLTFRMTVELARRARLRRALAGLLLLMLIVVASHGLVEHYIWSGGVHQVSDSPYGGTSPWGPFNNRNHFAGYVLPGLGLALGMTILGSPVAYRLLAGAGLAVAFASLLGSLSRSGIVAFGVAAVSGFAAAAHTWRTNRAGSTRRLGFRIVGAAMSVAVLAGLALWGLQAAGGLERIADRMATLTVPFEEPSTRGRIQIWRDTLPMIADRPIMGFGLGTYVWAHLPYRTPFEASLPQHAHNEYLELTVETGLVGAALATWLLWRLLGALWHNLARAVGRREAGLYLGSLAGWLGTLAYAMVDFPTVAAATDYVLAVIAGIAVIRPADRSEQETLSDAPGQRSNGKRTEDRRTVPRAELPT